MLIISWSFSGGVAAQSIELVDLGVDTDSSYYDIYRLSNQEIWIGGEYGVLKRLRADGSLEHIAYPNSGSNILKFLQLGNFVYISADHGTIYKYNLQDSTCTLTQFDGFKHRCFYDLAYDQQGHLIVSGGSSGIGRGKKRIPNGFIARIDTSLSTTPEVVWKSKFQFVWALAEHPDGGMAAAVFNGMSSRIYRCADLTTSNWVAGDKVKGLIHALQPIDGKLAYSGCRSVSYHKTGIWGYELDAKSYTEVTGAGIICNLIQQPEGIYGFSSQGHVYRLGDGLAEKVYSTQDGFALYEGLLDEDAGMLLVGHGKIALKIYLKD